MAPRILFFDGTCNLCNGFVDFLIGQKADLSFASLQGSTAEHLVPEHLKVKLSTVVYLRDGEFLTQSEAVASVLYDLGGSYTLIGSFLRVCPSFITNGLYQLISKRRYGLFGKRDTCRLPKPEEQAYFLP